MDFLFINRDELEALNGLPYSHRVCYLMAIRPYMDRKSSIVGIKRKISYQSLAETLYIEPIPGSKEVNLSRQQLRRIVKSLERAGLIELRSVGRQLIFRCLLASQDKFIQNAPDTRPTQEADTRPSAHSPINTTDFSNSPPKADTPKPIKGDTPHNSVNMYVCVSKNFEIFWSLYPEKQGKKQAFDAFHSLAADENLFSEMIAALKKQISHREQLSASGQWVPRWKYPANWLNQACWNDEISDIEVKERSHATPKRHPAKQLAQDILWSGCQNVQYEFDDDSSTEQESNNNVINFNSFTRG